MPLPAGALEIFVQENELDESAVNALAQVSPEVQARVIAEGVVTGRNKSAILIGRIRRCLRGGEEAKPLSTGALGQRGSLPVAVPADFDPQQHNVQMENFLREHGFDDYAEKVLLEQRTEVQIRVLADGEVTGDNKSRILMGRIKRAQAGLRNGGANLAGAQSPNLKAVEDFVVANEIDGLAVRELHSLPPQKQLMVINEGDITGGNKSAILMGRIRRVNQGEAPGLNSLRAEAPGLNSFLAPLSPQGPLQQQQQQQYAQQAQWQQLMLQWQQVYNLQQQQQQQQQQMALGQSQHLMDPLAAMSNAQHMALGASPCHPQSAVLQTEARGKAASSALPPFPSAGLASSPLQQEQFGMLEQQPSGQPSVPSSLQWRAEQIRQAAQAQVAYVQAYQRAFLQQAGEAPQQPATQCNWESQASSALARDDDTSQGMHPKLNDFIRDNHLDAGAENVLRQQSPHIIQRVLDEGTIVGGVNRSAILISRIRRVQKDMT